MTDIRVHEEGSLSSFGSFPVCVPVLVGSVETTRDGLRLVIREFLFRIFVLV